MDPVGLAIGVAGLGSLFTSCVQLCEIIDSGKRYGIDYEILATKVGVEQVRLTLWGESVGISRISSNGSSCSTLRPLDHRLEDQRISKAVFDVLSCMKRLFEDTNALKRRYGLQPSTMDDSQIQTDSRRTALLSTFKRTYDNFQLAAAYKQRNVSFKAASKWAITDKKRFQQFIDDLRGFNDSLVALFPDIVISARAEMAADIRASINADDLRIIEQAVADGDEELFDAASVRLSEISQQQPQLHPEPQGEVDDASQASSIVRPVNIDYLARQMDKLGVELNAKNEGALEISIYNSWGIKYWSFAGWNGVSGSDHFAQKDQELEFVKHPYLAWSLQHATERKKNSQGFFGDQNAEANRKHEGKFPGTVTVNGYAGEFCEWAEINTPQEPQIVFSSTSTLPTHKMEQLVDRLRILQTRKDLPWGQSAEESSLELRQLIGTAGHNYTNPSYEHDITSQISRLLEQLNRHDIFEDFRRGGSISTLALAPPELGFKGLPNFLLQIILAYELRLRLKKTTTTFSGLTKRVVATLEITDRWIENVMAVMPENKANWVDLHSLVHERQVEGLIRFAEVMEWPHLGEMREFAEEVYSSVRSGANIDTAVWDWIFGVVFPGDNFVFKIMSALVMTTPSLQPLGGSAFPAASLILPDRSYWRSRYIVGGVLAGIKGVKSVCGWVGPCPPVADSSIKGWVRIRSRKPAFKLPSESLRGDAAGEEGEKFSSTSLNDMPIDSRGAWIRETGNPSRWVIPVGPSPQAATAVSQRYTFGALHLKEVAPGPSGIPGLKCPEYRASIEIAISSNNATTDELDNSSVTFTLFSQPTFIATHRCIDGPHSVHERDLPRLQNICSISDLITRHRNNGSQQQQQRRGDVLIIDATCEGGELVARAWCADNGHHAVVRRGVGTCFACSVRMASNEGLGVGYLVWT